VWARRRRMRNHVIRAPTRANNTTPPTVPPATAPTLIPFLLSEEKDGLEVIEAAAAAEELGTLAVVDVKEPVVTIAEELKVFELVGFDGNGAVELELVVVFDPDGIVELELVVVFDPDATFEAFC